MASNVATTSDAAARARVARRNARRRLRFTTRGRIVLVVLLAILAALLALGIDAARSAAATEDAEAAVQPTVIVQPGDTLWEIARDAVPRDDPRETVQRLLDLNGLPSPVIVPGQELAVPGP
jgi:LysM repeat protein